MFVRGFQCSRILNNNNKRTSEKLLDNNRKETVSRQFSDKTQDKAEIKPPLPPPGLPEEAVYSQDYYLSKIKRKMKGKSKKGVGQMNGFQNGPKILIQMKKSIHIFITFIMILGVQ